MEAVVEHPVINSTTDGVKTSIDEELPTSVAESNVCHKSNGVDCTTTCNENAAVEPSDNSESTQEVITADIPIEVSEHSESLALESTNEQTTKESATDNCNTDSKALTVDNNVHEISEVVEPCDSKEDSTILSDPVITDIPNENVESVSVCKVEDNDDDNKNNTPDDSTIKESPANDGQESQENELELGSSVECTSTTTINDGVHFETEILIEKGDNDVHESVFIESETMITDNTNNILGELGENIELSEVLQSSDVANNGENNNAATKEEVFNKEELLDILEGNDVDQSINESDKKQASESQQALKQLSMLKSQRSSKKRNKSKETFVIEKVVTEENTENKETDKSQGQVNIVSVLVMDWDDEEPTDRKEKDTTAAANPVDKTGHNHDSTEVNEEPCGRSSVESALSEDPSLRPIKSEDDSPPKRLGRVIKKKVIFDPDNPDTYTKSKTPSKTKEIHIVKEQPSVKKGKIEHTPQRMKSRSPTGKMQWKKPSPRNSKQNKRLSEVDKLLMDEGAVNMIYQLTSEAPKGRKNVRTKAEFIKKIQSSTPDGKEMKFRERKKETKYDDGEAKKILGGKHRTSLSSSVKSPSVCEDFDSHSADDSIIYRRHSSSSYSSSCMSPRRLSDVESNSQNNKPMPLPAENSVNNDHNLKNPSDDIFMSETNSIPTDMKSALINKEDCLSIKEKLNSRLSLALNKRKRDSSKPEKPAKQKKIKSEEVDLTKSDKPKEFKFISVNIDQHLAEICLQKTGLKDSIEVLKEMENALKLIDDNPEISVTLLSSQCGTLCSSLDLSVLIHENSEIRATNAYDFAESVRSLLAAVSAHGKLVCCGVWGACSGVALALVALSDVALASERATFALAGAAPVLPATAALAAPHRALPRALVNDLVVFGRRVSAAEALRGGLVSRTLWPDRFDEQVRHIVRDLALQPMQAILLKKRLLGLRETKEGQANFLSCLESERDLLVQYWTSVEGQELLRAALDAA